MQYYRFWFAVWKPDVLFHYNRTCPKLKNGSDIRGDESISTAHIPADADGGQDAGRGAEMKLNLCDCVPDDLFELDSK